MWPSMAVSGQAELRKKKAERKGFVHGSELEMMADVRMIPLGILVYAY